jgi:hypothetical protein
MVEQHQLAMLLPDELLGQAAFPIFRNMPSAFSHPMLFRLEDIQIKREERNGDYGVRKFEYQRGFPSVDARLEAALVVSARENAGATAPSAHRHETGTTLWQVERSQSVKVSCWIKRGSG